CTRTYYSNFAYW
nr:immunoglobulin heavy chain junction region [Mus musculus]